VLVIAKSAPEVVVFAIETISLAVAGERVVDDLLQNPTVPDPEPVIFPLQVKLPVELATVHPVAEDPPAIFTLILPSTCNSRLVAGAVNVKLPPAGPVIEDPEFASTNVKSPVEATCNSSVPSPTSRYASGVVSPPMPTFPAI
jgi:hypothetical protein